MAKLIIFDLDGVLVDTKLIHFEALNEALKKNKFNPISYDDHIKIFDGLPTTEKLKILIDKKKVSNKKINLIKKEKAYITSKLLQKYISERGKMIPSRITSVSAKKQRELAIAVKRARFLGLLPYLLR